VKRLIILCLMVGVQSSAQVAYGPSVKLTSHSFTSNGIELTPSMGWNPWQVFGAATTEAQIEANCLAMSTNGMLAAGYNYCSVDGVWTTSRVSGALVPTASYPDMTALGTYIHSHGMKYAHYLSMGAPGSGCDGQPASSGFEYQDVAQMVSWGVDYIKADSCYASWTTATAQLGYSTLYKAQALSGRQMRLYSSLGPTDCFPSACAFAWTWFSSIGASEQSTDADLTFNFPGGPPWWMTYANLITAVDDQFGLASFGGINHYLLPGLQLGVGNGALTDAQGVADMSLMAELASPLWVSIDLTAPPSANTMATLLNRQVIAVDQDSAGITGARVSQVTCGSAFCEVYAKQLAGTNKWALVLWNQDSAPHSIAATWSMFGQSGTYTNTANLWANWPSCGGSTTCAASLGSLTTGYTTTVPAFSVFMMTVAP
jgi:alpha-galactosidase